MRVAIKIQSLVEPFTKIGLLARLQEKIKRGREGERERRGPASSAFRRASSSSLIVSSALSLDTGPLSPLKFLDGEVKLE